MFKICCFFALFLLFFSCSNEPKKEKKTNWTIEKSAAVNRSFAHEEEMHIRLWVNRHKKYNFTKTATGLRYCIYDNKEGPTVKSFDKVEVNFRIYQLDGSVIYQTDSTETSDFTVDKDYVETGIMEGIKHMSVGDKGVFIIPSRMAHGLLGDLNKIPPLTVLVVYMDLKKIDK